MMISERCRTASHETCRGCVKEPDGMVNCDCWCHQPDEAEEGVDHTLRPTSPGQQDYDSLYPFPPHQVPAGDPR